MSETTPLNNNPKSYTEEEYEEYEEFSLSPRGRAFAYSIGGLLILGSLYFFCIFLPAYFIPQLVELEGIVKLSQLDVTLEPLSAERVSELGLPEHGDVADILESALATKPDTKKKVERIIMVGDIHGHYDEFMKLLKKVKYSKKNDHLLVLGDFITKGPDSMKVLDYLIEHDIDCILGNHEYYVLQNYANFHRLRAPFFANSTESAQSPVHAKSDFNDDPEFLLAKKLHPHQVGYINHCSIIKELGPMPLHKSKSNASYKSAQGVAVHAGLRWDLALEEQNPEENLELRSYIGPYYNETTNDPFQKHAVSWSKIFNGKQKEASNDEALIVYYGHDARRGLNLKKFTKGLDSGCDRGDQLSAMVVWNEVDSKGRTLYRDEVYQVNC